MEQFGADLVLLNPGTVAPQATDGEPSGQGFLSVIISLARAEGSEAEHCDAHIDSARPTLLRQREGKRGEDSTVL